MAFDKDTRHLLAKTVAACRRRLTEDVTDQLRGVFGMHPDGTVLPLEKMAHLSPDQAAAARRLRDLLDHFTAGEAGKEQDRRKAAYERMTLEISFTILNRLAALRLCEERGLVVECVRKGTASDGFRLFERISGGALGGRYAAYRVFIECLFDELALDLGVLFDRMTPQSTVFPTERCMEDVLAELNKAELTHLWTEDETIGWVYQYFNPPEERKAMREASQAPRNSRELAVRNQFFTPRYVVEFLSDNTLGRIWYEMRKGKTALKDECLYLVRRPNEVFLASGEKTPAKPESETDLSQEELLKKTVHIEHRPKKDPREIKILDPACGSGHFLLYAFDLLEHIYEEAWADADGPKFEAAGRTLRENFETLDDLRRAVPKLIIEHNLHGIDIDTRAVQIAALALWLRAQKAWKNLSLKVAERPQVTKSNIVVAEPMPGEEGMRNEFVESLKPRVLGQLVDVVFEKMMLAGEAGSLLKIEEEIKDAVVEAKKQWLKRPKDEQAVLFEELKKPKAAQTEMQFDFTGVTDEEFWEQAEDRILDALKEYSEQAENGRAIRRRLFAEDAARGFAFMDLCRKRFDVVLMNPPFGEFSDGSVDYIMSRYPDSRQDIFAAFVERCVTDFCSNGYTGVLSKESGFFLRTLKNWRRSVLLGRTTMSAMIHLGGHVLDGATVRTSAYVLRTPNEKLTSVFIRLLGKDDREARLLRKLDAISGSLGDRDVYITPQTEFEKLPFGVFGYWCSAELRNSFTALPSLEDRGGSVRVGLQTSDDFRFLRLRFEVSPGLIESHKWYPYAKGGEYRPFHDDIHLVTQFPTEGSALAEFPKVVVRNSIDYFKPGLTYPPRTNKRFAPRVLPAGCIFGQKDQP